MLLEVRSDYTIQRIPLVPLHTNLDNARKRRRVHRTMRGRPKKVLPLSVNVQFLRSVALPSVHPQVLRPVQIHLASRSTHPIRRVVTNVPDSGDIRHIPVRIIRVSNQPIRRGCHSHMKCRRGTLGRRLVGQSPSLVALGRVT